MPPDLAAALDAQTEDEVELWPDMRDSVGLFLAMGTQWRWAGAGMAGAFRTGLDYSALATVAEAIGTKVTPEVLADLRIMEGAAVEQWSRKR